jgi:hypothetical protein
MNFMVEKLKRIYNISIEDAELKSAFRARK